MTTTHEIEPGRPIDLGCEVVGLCADRRAVLVEQQPGRAPKRIDGFTVGAPVREPGRLVHITPGPNGGSRPRAGGG